MAIIFINYRRSDSSGWTRGLHERLADGFGSHLIFYDVDDITIGENFVSSVVKNLDDCRIVLTVIGPSWLNVRQADGSRRIDDPNDHVRREIELAMQRNLMIIPVLVGGAEMPSARQLPPSIAALSTRNALTVSDSRFSDDMERLIRVIRSVCGIAAQTERHQKLTPPPEKKGFSGLSFILGGVAALVIGILGIVLLIAILTQIPDENGNQNTVVNNRTPEPENNGEIDYATLVQVYCDAFKQGVNKQMQYGRVNAPRCVAPNDLASFNNSQIRCGGFVNGIVETARLQGDSSLEAETDNLYNACLAEIQ